MQPLWPLQLKIKYILELHQLTCAWCTEPKRANQAWESAISNQFIEVQCTMHTCCTPHALYIVCIQHIAQCFGVECMYSSWVCTSMRSHLSMMGGWYPTNLLMHMCCTLHTTQYALHIVLQCALQCLAICQWWVVVVSSGGQESLWQFSQLLFTLSLPHLCIIGSNRMQDNLLAQLSSIAKRSD